MDTKDSPFPGFDIPNGSAKPADIARGKEDSSSTCDWKGFGAEVSIGGLKYCIEPDFFILRRLLWGCLVLFGLGFSIYQIYIQLSTFFSYPTNVDILVNVAPSLDFPTVTICNENQFNRTAVEAFDPKLIDAFQALNPPLPSSQPLNYTAIKELLKDHKDEDWADIYPRFLLDIEQLIIQCTYSGAMCDKNHFREIMTPMGRCLQFNYDADLVVYQAGASFGLRLVFIVDQENYLVPLSPSAGYRVLIHDAAEEPLVEEWGFMASVNQHSQVQITHSEVIKMPEPYGSCRDQDGYRENKCLSDCVETFIKEGCGCAFYYMNRTREGPPYPVCDPETGHKCIASGATLLAEDVLSNPCDCPSQCESTFYPFSLSSSLPSRFFVDWAIEENRKTSGLNITHQYVEEEFVMLDIFYSKLESESLVTNAAYSRTDLFCDIGGALGLILGSTLLTLFEILDFVIVNSWNSGRRKERPQTNEGVTKF